ncbi:MAG: hypothetical protein L0332_31185 [Chloroflexi bacterium]|nr:hypothetical protein [Chloroflexota bacterium]MCI0644456.1 hypothetical protein [Chloroflexota bacterium]MCI0731166.1 hypothetical protein [Chloroflexota bacterium]
MIYHTGYPVPEPPAGRVALASQIRTEWTFRRPHLKNLRLLPCRMTRPARAPIGPW